MNVLPKTFLQIILAASAAFNSVPPASSDDLCLPFSLILIVEYIQRLAYTWPR